MQIWSEQESGPHIGSSTQRLIIYHTANQFRPGESPGKPHRERCIVRLLAVRTGPRRGQLTVFLTNVSENPSFDSVRPIAQTCRQCLYGDSRCPTGCSRVLCTDILEWYWGNTAPLSTRSLHSSLSRAVRFPGDDHRTGQIYCMCRYL